MFEVLSRSTSTADGFLYAIRPMRTYFAEIPRSLSGWIMKGSDSVTVTTDAAAGGPRPAVDLENF